MTLCRHNTLTSIKLRAPIEFAAPCNSVAAAAESSPMHSEFNASSKSVAAPAGFPIPSESSSRPANQSRHQQPTIAPWNNGGTTRSTGRKRTGRTPKGGRSNPHEVRRICRLHAPLGACIFTYFPEPTKKDELRSRFKQSILRALSITHKALKPTHQIKERRMD